MFHLASFEIDFSDVLSLNLNNRFLISSTLIADRLNVCRGDWGKTGYLWLAYLHRSMGYVLSEPFLWVLSNVSSAKSTYILKILEILSKQTPLLMWQLIHALHRKN